MSELRPHTHAEFLSADKMHERLLAAIDAAGSQKTLAHQCCITPRAISMCVNGDRPISDRVARRLGYRRVVAYLPIGGGE